MSLLGAAKAMVHLGPPALVASRRLGVLDELAVPYEHRNVSEKTDWAWLAGSRPTGGLHWFAGDGKVAAGWSLGSLKLWGRVASDERAVALVASLAGEWRRELPILDASGVPQASVWRSSAGGTILPFDPDELIANLRCERYLRMRGAHRLALKAFARRNYYAIRPLLPRRVQIAARRGFRHAQARAVFPRWPVEPTIPDLVDLVLQRAADAAGTPIPHLASWPQGRSWALVLTHDVETAAGRDKIETVRALERQAGYRSSWNFVPERYQVDEALVERLRSDGCEVGVHGLRHDGRDFNSRRTFERRLPEIRRWAEQWGASGFRSPGTHRVWEWMPRLGFDYDTSYPDTDPYEPMAGGCCSWLPFFNQGMVELPITLVQDHTMFVILRSDESLWLEKAQLLRAKGGLALALVHPDYIVESDRLAAYARFLGAFREDPGVWTPLPREVAHWWRRRAATSLRWIDDGWCASGPAEHEVNIALTEPAIAFAAN